MPTYEYRCPNGHLTEKFAKISESTAQLPCAVCGAIAERQISGGAGLVFKGSGFYLTDYGRSGSKAEKARSESRAESKSDGKSEGKSEAKSDSKSGGEAKSSDSGVKSEIAAAPSKKDSASTPATKPSPKTE